MKRFVVYHGDYGCESGCCGHYLDVPSELKEFVSWSGRFQFGHPYDLYGVTDPAARQEIMRAYAEKVIRAEIPAEHLVDVDFHNPMIVDWQKVSED